MIFPEPVEPPSDLTTVAASSCTEAEQKLAALFARHDLYFDGRSLSKVVSIAARDKKRRDKTAIDESGQTRFSDEG